MGEFKEVIGTTLAPSTKSAPESISKITTPSFPFSLHSAAAVVFPDLGCPIINHVSPPGMIVQSVFIFCTFNSTIFSL